MNTTFAMPAEWEPHAGTWLAWPHRKSDWPGKFAPIAPVYADIIRVLSRTERVNVLVRDGAMRKRAGRWLKAVKADLANVEFFTSETDRSWVRDSGPIFVRDSAGQIVALDWHFNAWAKYPDWQIDDELPAFVSHARGVRSIRPQFHSKRVVLEGGSIDANGEGLLLTTEECLLSTIQERNPGMGRADYEAVFAEYLGIRRVIWLGHGIVGDDTHGHVDDLARFVAPRTVATVIESDEADPNYLPLRENFERLESYRDVDGSKLEVVPLPMPRPVWFRGTRLPASYANFYIANGVVLAPTFNDPADRIALGTLAELFPDREVVGIHCSDLVWGFGTLHCMTQQEPAARKIVF